MDVMFGDQYIVDVIVYLQVSLQWKNMVVVVMYDENGGFWDYVVLLIVDCWGLGICILVLIVLLFVKKGFVDYMQYDMGLILCFIMCCFLLLCFVGLQ